MFDNFLQDDGEAEGNQNLIRMRAIIKMLDQPALHHHPDDQHDGNGEQNRQRYGVFDQHAADIAEPDLDIRCANFHRSTPGGCLRGIEYHLLQADQFVE